jgi:lysophospholipase L1-like esterase
MKKEAIYLVYIISILLITVYLSFLIIGEKTKPRYILVTPDLSYKEKTFETLEECPCKKVGIEPSKCPHIYLKESSNPNLNIQLRPNVEQIADGFGICIPAFHVKINSYGFRDYEYSMEKPPNTFRIVVLGDSITFGEGVELNETYSKVLEKLLNEKNGGKIKYEVLNFGVGSYNAAEKVEVLATVAINFTPDLIIFQYLGDDIINWTEFREIEHEKIENYLQKVNKSREKLNRIELQDLHISIYQEYLRRLEEKNFEEVWKIVEEAFERLASITQGKINVLLIFQTDEHQISRLKKIASKYNWSTLDMNDIFRGYPQEKIIIHPKDPHPNAFAHKLIAEEITKFFSQKI